MNTPIKILLVEDDQDDVDLLIEALNDNHILYTIDVISDGGLVEEYIEKCTVHPDVVVLDYNLPRVHGRELLTLFKSTQGFKDIPVIILTTSSSKKDMDYAYDEGAAKFLIKPTTVQGINQIISDIIGTI